MCPLSGSESSARRYRAFHIDSALPTLCCRQAVVNPANTFFSVKRLIGREYEAVEAEAARLPFGVAADEDGTAVLECAAAEGGGVGGQLGPVGDISPAHALALP